MEFLRPEKNKFKITGIIVLVIIIYSLMSGYGSHLLNRTSISEFEKAAKIELEKDAKPLLEKIETQSFNGMKYSTIYYKALLKTLSLSVVLMFLFSYLGSCFICYYFIKTK